MDGNGMQTVMPVSGGWRWVWLRRRHVVYVARRNFRSDGRRRFRRLE